MALSDRQRKYLRNYVIDFNQARACKETGTCSSSARNWTTSVEGQKYIKKLTDAALERTDVSIDRVLNEYARIAFFNVQTIYDNDGKIKDIDKISIDDAAAIQEVVRTEYKGAGRLAVKCHDKLKALDFLAKYLGMLIEKQELTVNTLSESDLDAKIEEQIAQYRSKSHLKAI